MHDGEQCRLHLGDRLFDRRRPGTRRPTRPRACAPRRRAARDLGEQVAEPAEDRHEHAVAGARRARRSPPRCRARGAVDEQRRLVPRCGTRRGRAPGSRSCTPSSPGRTGPTSCADIARQHPRVRVDGSRPHEQARGRVDRRGDNDDPDSDVWGGQATEPEVFQRGARPELAATASSAVAAARASRAHAGRCAADREQGRRQRRRPVTPATAVIAAVATASISPPSASSAGATDAAEGSTRTASPSTASVAQRATSQRPRPAARRRRRDRGRPREARRDIRAERSGCARTRAVRRPGLDGLHRAEVLVQRVEGHIAEGRIVEDGDVAGPIRRAPTNAARTSGVADSAAPAPSRSRPSGRAVPGATGGASRLAATASRSAGSRANQPTVSNDGASGRHAPRGSRRRTWCAAPRAPGRTPGCGSSRPCRSRGRSRPGPARPPAPGRSTSPRRSRRARPGSAGCRTRRSGRRCCTRTGRSARCRGPRRRVEQAAQARGRIRLARSLLEVRGDTRRRARTPSTANTSLTATVARRARRSPSGRRAGRRRRATPADRAALPSARSRRAAGPPGRRAAGSRSFGCARARPTRSTTCEMSKSVAREVGERGAAPSVPRPEARSRCARSPASRRRGRGPCRSDEVLARLGERAGEPPNSRTAVSAGTTSNRKAARSDASSAVSATSPSPCAGCDRRRTRARPAPAPAGRGSPPGEQVMSMLPPCAPGGTECGRSSASTATPMMPRNRASGKRTTRSPPSARGSAPNHPPLASRRSA